MEQKRSINIPGLIAKETYNDLEMNKLSDETVQKENVATMSHFEELMRKSYSDKVEAFKQSLEGYVQQQIGTSALPSYGGINKKTRIPQRQVFGPPDYSKDNSLDSYLKYTQGQKKSKFEDIIDALFTLEEKLEYLKSIGYRHLENSSYLVKGEVDPEFKRTYQVDEAFLLEITIKFKNLLLTKGTLKLKL